MLKLASDVYFIQIASISSPLFYLVFFLVDICHSSMRKEEIVRNYVRFSGRVSGSAEKTQKDGAPSWSLETYIIPLYGKCMRLIECDPVLHPITKFLKASLCKCCVVLSVNDE